MKKLIEECNPQEVELLFVGAGRSENSLKRLSRKLNIDKNVKFLGWLPRKTVLDILRDCDIFLFPSFEGGGMVVLEAMALGLPVVCLDFGGPGEIVDETSGIKIKPTAFHQTIEGLAEALYQLLLDPGLRKKLGQGAVERVKKYFTWDKKGEQVREIYEELGIL